MPSSSLRKTALRVTVPLLVVANFQWFLVQAATIPSRFSQGSQHGFLALRTQDGKRIATGDVTQSVKGDVVTSRIIFRFRDGSTDDDLTSFSQQGVFRLISDHHVQKGP